MYFKAINTNNREVNYDGKNRFISHKYYLAFPVSTN